jgi:hypothetical protein
MIRNSGQRPRAKGRLPCWLGSLVLLGVFAPQSAIACNEYSASLFRIRPDAFAVRASAAIQTLDPGRFGSLAVRIDRSRYLVLLKPGCYDLSNFDLQSEVPIVFNHRSQEDESREPTYIGFQVIRAMPQIKSNYVSVFRNKSSTDESPWLLPRDDSSLTNFKSKKTLARQDATVETDEYESEIESTGDTRGLLDNLNNPDLARFNSTFGNWHALVGQGDQAASPWNVTINTALDHPTWQLSPNNLKMMVGTERFVIRNYMLKYTPSIKPKSPVVFNVRTTDVACVYIKPIAHADELARMRISRPITLKLTHAACIEPDVAFKEAR